MPADGPLLEARRIGRRAPRSETWLLHDVSLAIHPGARLAIVGPTGTGKTLLLRALALLDPVDAGEVLWRGQPVPGRAVPEFRRNAVYIHQRPVLVAGTVEANLRLPFSLGAHQASRFDRGRVGEWLAHVGRNESFLAKSAAALSGGEAQIVALLRAIQLNPALLLLLDEPTAALDAVRTIVQLTLIGLVLQWVFAMNRWYTVLLLVAVMTVMAGTAAVNRTDRRYPGVYQNSIVSVWASTWLISAFALLVVMRQVQPWYQPQYAIPFAGMILGNTLNGISLGLNRLGEELVGHRDEVEMLLSLGATRWEAARSRVRQAVRTGMIPIINSMMVVGIVNLPGMMTGQLIAGVDPIEAVKYQIVIMFLIASGTSLGTISVVLLSYRRLFNPRHQFAYWLIDQRRA